MNPVAIAVFSCYAVFKKGDKVYRIIGLLLAFVWITGCASRPTAETATGATALPTPELRWSVSLTQSGGIMGLMRSIEINSDGEFSATDERLGKTVSGKLTEDELAELQMLVTNLKFTEPPRPNAVCADCFVYDFQIQTGGKTSSIQLDDITLPNSGLELLAASLVELLNVKLR